MIRTRAAPRRPHEHGDDVTYGRSRNRPPTPWRGTGLAL